ncbi:outer membrane lipoprotein carrier protein [Paucidesulfovibrio gracilis DSM 16080]|uniref:Outer membrane lipoprotein carrier protein n=1 Tax=Paucidesulfovibrio gracilis DSM 16080 TaxID=1121449 RepID=A0A1T4WNZ3_9BACT|nr:outer membrane lipoprotein carrier protein LolA [Paucidesulfovibrio gracilis]SKA78837.1 outer membrane lipoprotein carrier protein [Paucidesulfovibrio gracilis DSM 16080]
MRFIQWLTIFFLIFMLQLPAGAEDTTEVADKIQQRYETIQSFEADFTQRLTRAAIGTTTETKGRIWFQRPALVRWETREPEEAMETIVVTEDAVWDYLHELNTVNQMPVEQLLNSRTLMRFLTGSANLVEDFRVEGVWDGQEKLAEHWADSGLMLFRLVPHEPEPGMLFAYIGVEPETFILRRIMTVDFQGNGNEIHLENLTVDVDLDANLFTFTPPEGAVVNESMQ